MNDAIAADDESDEQLSINVAGETLTLDEVKADTAEAHSQLDKYSDGALSTAAALNDAIVDAELRGDFEAVRQLRSIREDVEAVYDRVGVREDA